MALDRRMARLRARHAQEINGMFRVFAGINPTVETGVRDADLTPAQRAEWRKFIAPTLEDHRKERSALAERLRAEHARRAS